MVYVQYVEHMSKQIWEKNIELKTHFALFQHEYSRYCTPVMLKQSIIFII